LLARQAPTVSDRSALQLVLVLLMSNMGAGAKVRAGSDGRLLQPKTYHFRPRKAHSETRAPALYPPSALAGYSRLLVIASNGRSRIAFILAGTGRLRNAKRFRAHIATDRATFPTPATRA